MQVNEINGYTVVRLKRTEVSQMANLMKGNISVSYIVDFNNEINGYTSLIEMMDLPADYFELNQIFIIKKGSG